MTHSFFLLLPFVIFLLQPFIPLSVFVYVPYLPTAFTHVSLRIGFLCFLTSSPTQFPLLFVFLPLFPRLLLPPLFLFYCSLFCLREKSAAAVSFLLLTSVTSASDWIIGDIDVAMEQINNHRQETMPLKPQVVLGLNTDWRALQSFGFKLR